MWDNVVNEALIKRGIDNIGKLNTRSLAEAFNITVFYWECSTRIVKYDKKYYCIIDARKNSVEQYEEFLHEVAHIIFDADLTSIKVNWFHFYREYKVDHLVPMIAIPKFALDIIKEKSVEEISEEFNITHELVRKRLERLKNREVIRWHQSENAGVSLG